jgi:hypothetical protein
LASSVVIEVRDPHSRAKRASSRHTNRPAVWHNAVDVR